LSTGARSGFAPPVLGKSRPAPGRAGSVPRESPSGAAFSVRAMLLLRILSRGELVRDLRVQQEEAFLGRDPENAVPLPDPRVSRRHAVIRRAPDGYRLFDLESGTGTTCNDRPVPSSGEGVRLLPGDAVRIGEFRIEVSAWDPSGTGGESPERLYVSERDACGLLQAGDAELSRFVREGRVATLAVEGRLLIRKADVEALRAVLQAESTRRLARPLPLDVDTVPVADAARLAGVSEDDLRGWIAEGKVRAYRDRGEVLVKKAEILDFLRRPPAPSPLPEAPGVPAPPPVREGADSLVPIRELAGLLGVSAAKAEEMAARAGLPLFPAPDGGKCARRPDLADRLLGPAAPASLVEPAALHWPGPSAAERAQGEAEPEDAEEEATEETSETSRGAKSEELKGILTVRYYDRMSPGRTFPLLVQAAKLTGPIRAVPRLPGCLCVPAGEDLTPDGPRAEFWITPQAVGPAPRASVEILGRGSRVAEVRVPFFVRRLAPAWGFLALAGGFLALAVLLEAFAPSVEKTSMLARILAALGGGAPAGLLLSMAAFVAGAAWFFFANPREANAVTISLAPRPPEGG
jgi:excisionase family DNA binding protein